MVDNQDLSICRVWVELVSQYLGTVYRRLVGCFLDPLELCFILTRDPDTFRVPGVPDHRSTGQLLLPFPGVDLLFHRLPDGPWIDLALVLLSNSRHIDCVIQCIGHPRWRCAN